MDQIGSLRCTVSNASRSYKLYLVTDSAPKVRIQFVVVGGDAGYLDHPVTTTDLVISMAERWEVIIDFKEYKGQNLTLMNERDFETNDDYPATDKVIRFVVGEDGGDSEGNGNIPNKLANLALPESHAKVDQEYEFARKNGEWLINGVGFEDVKKRVIAKPP